MLWDDESDTTFRPGVLPRPSIAPVVALVAVALALIPALFCVGYILGALLIR